MIESRDRLGVLVYLLLAVISSTCVFEARAAAQQKSAAANAPGKYNGPGSCSASGCHGGVQPTNIHTRNGVWLNEYFIWATRDPHFKSFNTLQSARSGHMIKILRAADPERWNKAADEEPKCLACHALASAAASKSHTFEVEGVSCESCHGASSGWFSTHYQTNWTTEQSIKSGMVAIRDVAQRSEKCLTCHLGAREQEVDHRMIAAGHPDLFFELDLFSAKQPPHWKPSADRNYGVRLWAVGQAVQLREALDRLARRADRASSQHGSWPEFSELDCFSCHHAVNSNWQDSGSERPSAKAPDTWRQARGYGDRAIGSPPWNSAHYSVFMVLLKEVNLPESQKLEGQLKELYQSVSSLNSQPADVKAKALNARDTAAQLVTKVDQIKFEKPLVSRLLQQISAQGESIASQDTRSAEQAYMALDSLFRCYDDKIQMGHPLTTGAHPAAGAAIDQLYKEFNDPSAYNGPRFAAAMRRVNQALHQEHIVAAK